MFNALSSLLPSWLLPSSNSEPAASTEPAPAVVTTDTKTDAAYPPKPSKPSKPTKPSKRKRRRANKPRSSPAVVGINELTGATAVVYPTGPLPSAVPSVKAIAATEADKRQLIDLRRRGRSAERLSSLTTSSNKKPAPKRPSSVRTQPMPRGQASRSSARVGSFAK
jgi:hypothetical protein